MKIDPLFVRDLKKGDMVDSATVAGMMQLTPEDLLDIDRIRIAALKLSSMIERALHKMQRIWTLQCKDGAIHVLTDSEAVAFRRRQNAAGVRKVRRSYKGLQGIDTSNLNQIDAANHLSSLNRASAQALALNSINRTRDPATMGKAVAAADPARPRIRRTPLPSTPFDKINSDRQINA